MPVIIAKDLPAFDILTKENIFVMGVDRANSQDIRPLEIAIVNLMPTKIETETQFMRVLGNSPLQINCTLVRMKTYNPSNTSSEHLDKFYKTFDEIKNETFDGMIITGAPVEKLDFPDVKYWNELCDIFDYAEKNVTSSLFICWGAQAALNYYYGVDKIEYSEKLSGIYTNKALEYNDPLLRGLNDEFNIPHSRYTGVRKEDILENGFLNIIAEGEKCGPSIIKSIDNKKVFFLGHAEYDRDTLKKEYQRDIAKGLDIKKPENYFIGDSIEDINMSWKSTGTLLYTNWLNYYVYQITPYSLVKK
ncbi:MAG: homoserine O-succinyltransferase [Clostridia bacterium]|nr:homoserine O-succinyltransferase [Clostridia bacterium]